MAEIKYEITKHVIIMNDEENKVFVFNEDYTNNQVRLREDGLGTIVMFGELGNIADEISPGASLAAS